ncbi:MAG: hypothetical protein J6M18_04880 [Actinomycetaceae bacterium]|nr:hypothetical protein [Actinomycetaceae bacterium]
MKTSRATQLAALSALSAVGMTAIPGAAFADDNTPVDPTASQSGDTQQAKQKELDEARAQLSQAQQALADSQAQVEQAQNNCDEANANHAHNLTAVSVAKAQYEEAQRAVEQAQAEVDNCKKALEEAEAGTPVENASNTADTSATAEESEAPSEEAAANNNTNTAEANNQAQLDASQKAKGSAGFFAAQGATEAEKIVTGNHNQTPSWYSKYVKLGDEKDATSLDNMKKSLDIVRKANEYRAKDGLPQYKITHSLMAWAQIHTDFSRHYKEHANNIEHDGFDSANIAGAENIIWGRSNATDMLHGWYDDEKAHPENGQGHYKNLINKDYTLTGAAWNTHQTTFTYMGFYMNGTAGQVFRSSTNEQAFTPDEYEKLLDAYMNGTSSQAANTEEATSEDTQASQNGNDIVELSVHRLTATTQATVSATVVDDALVAEAEAALATAENNLKAAEEKLETALEELNNARATANETESILSDAQTALAAAQNNNKNCQASVTNAQNSVNTLQNALNDLQNIDTTVEEVSDALATDATISNSINEAANNALNDLADINLSVEDEAPEAVAKDASLPQTKTNETEVDLGDTLASQWSIIPQAKDATRESDTNLPNTGVGDDVQYTIETADLATTGKAFGSLLGLAGATTALGAAALKVSRRGRHSA